MLESAVDGASWNAMVIVHDTGTCTVQVQFGYDADEEQEWDDPHGDSLRQWPQHAGTLDLAGVLATIDGVIDAITPTPGGWYSELPASPVADHD